MKEDILEQIGDDWLNQMTSVFVKSNLKYKPLPSDMDYVKNKDNIPSDIDLLAVSFSDIETVTVINCKSWMDGFDFKSFHNHLNDLSKHDKNYSGKRYWKHFRELISPKWHRAFIQRIKQENPNFKKLKYIILTIKAKNKTSVVDWMLNPIITKNFNESEIELLCIESKEIHELIDEIKTEVGGYAENSDFCRTLQLLRVGNIIK